MTFECSKDIGKHGRSCHSASRSLDTPVVVVVLLLLVLLMSGQVSC